MGFGCEGDGPQGNFRDGGDGGRRRRKTEGMQGEAAKWRRVQDQRNESPEAKSVL